MVSGGETVAHQLPIEALAAFHEVNALSGTGKASQFYSEWTTPQQWHICDQSGWNGVSQTEHHSQGAMALVHEPRYHSGGRTSTSNPEHNCR